MPFGFQKPLHFDGGHASGARGGNGLPIGPVLDVAGVKNAGDVGARAAMRNNIAVRIQIDLAGERRWCSGCGRSPRRSRPRRAPRFHR